jgi:site-specific recombinase XerD
MSWHYTFPASALSTDKRTGRTGHHYILEPVIQKVMRKALLAAKVTKHGNIAAYFLEGVYNLCTVQELLGHKDVKTTWSIRTC